MVVSSALGMAASCKHMFTTKHCNHEHAGNAERTATARIRQRWYATSMPSPGPGMLAHRLCPSCCNTQLMYARSCEAYRSKEEEKIKKSALFLCR